MKKFIEFFAKQGLFSELTTFLILAVGLYSLLTIKKETFPNVKYDIITVYTSFPGAAASEVEKLITNPLEQELKEIDGIKEMVSTSSESISGILIRLDPDQTTESEAKSDIQEIVDNLKDLPEGAEDPKVSVLESKILPVISVGLTGGHLVQLKRSARYLQREIEKIPGVARVDLEGDRDYEVRVEISVDKLKNYQISFEEVIKALKDQNVSIPGGDFSQTKKGFKEDIIVRTEGQFNSIKDVENAVLRSNDLGRSILLKDIAHVYMGFVKEQNLVRTNGKESIGLVVLKKEKADVIKVVDSLKALMSEISQRPSPLSQVQMEWTYINDMSELVRRRLGVLSNNLMVGLLLVVLVLSLFLPFRLSLVTAVGIPFAFLGTMWFFSAQDISLNLITMMGLIIVIGMLVDDAVVVTENAVRHMEEGKKTYDSSH